MSIADIKKGDRLDYPAKELKNGEVTRVGHATVWLVFQTAVGGVFPMSADARDLRPHVDPNRVHVGEFVLRNVGEGKMSIESIVTGEAMQTDTAKLETVIAHFWNKEF